MGDAEQGFGLVAGHMLRRAFVGGEHRFAQGLGVGWPDDARGMVRRALDDRLLEFGEAEGGERRRRRDRIAHHLGQELELNRDGEFAPAHRRDQPVGVGGLNILRRIGLVDQQVDGDIAEQLRKFRAGAVMGERQFEFGAGNLVLGVNLAPQGGNAFVGDTMTERNIHDATPRKINLPLFLHARRIF